MKLARKYFWMFCLGFGPLSLSAQVTVSAVLDSARILIGDQTDLHLSASHPPDIDLRYPTLGEAQLSGLQIIKIGKIDTIATSPEIMTKQDITISAYDSGYYAIPRLAFIYNLGGGGPKTEYTQSLGLEVATVPVDTTSIAPIKPIMREPVKFSDVLPFIYGLVGVFALFFGGYFLYRKFKKEPEIEEAPPIVLPAHVIAFGKLHELEKEKLWQKGDIKLYQSKLTYIIREYLEKRFKTPALESTTDEILNALKNEEFSGDLKANLREMLQMADLVKFAKAKPPAEFHQEMMDKAYQFIETTKLIEEPIVEETENEQLDS
ncbi:MAG: hypothetical protein AAF502_02635 [Bacteroidota bacterium]